MTIHKGLEEDEIKEISISLDIEDTKIKGYVTAIKILPMNLVELEISFTSKDVEQIVSWNVSGMLVEPKYRIRPSSSNLRITIERSSEISKHIDQIIYRRNKKQ